MVEKRGAETGRRIAAIERSALLAEELRHSQENEALGSLASGVAHDFNNLLVAIIGNAEIMQPMVGDNPELIRSCREILGATEQARVLTAQLLGVSRQDGSLRRPIAVAAELERTEGMLKRLIPSHIEVSVASDGDDLGFVMAAPSDLNQLVLNLCINSRAAMPDGGELHVSASKSGPAEVKVVFRDTGTASRKT